jgi:hypothetical protein
LKYKTKNKNKFFEGLNLSLFFLSLFLFRISLNKNKEVICRYAKNTHFYTQITLFKTLFKLLEGLSQVWRGKIPHLRETALKSGGSDIHNRFWPSNYCAHCVKYYLAF